MSLIVPWGHDADAVVHVHLVVESLKHPLLSPLEPCGSRTKSVTAQAGAPLSPTDFPSLFALRKALRQRRSSLSRAEQLGHSLSICRQLLRRHWLQRARHVGLYLATNGEVDLAPLQLVLSDRPLQLYLPVLKPGRRKQLWFAPYALGARLVPNRFGIAEPDTNRSPPCSLRRLDLILMPLVGFDTALNRLGMGGGYYDRSLAFLRQSRWKRPRLIGVAHECQRVTSLEPAPWDIPLDAVVTERQLYLRHINQISH